MSVTKFKKEFIHRVLYLCLLGGIFFLLMGLGFWQIHRAEEKKNILQAFAAGQAMPALYWGVKQSEPPPFARVKVKGRVVPTIFYLDNQFSKHRVGYRVIIPLVVSGGKVLLVDMGWYPANPNRKQLPDIKVQSLRIWQGTVYFPKLSKVELGSFIDQKQGHRIVVETMDTQKIAEILHLETYPWVLRTEGSEWSVVSVTPERHYAYASQWFLMAVVVLIIFFWRIFNEKK